MTGGCLLIRITKILCLIHQNSRWLERSHSYELTLTQCTKISRWKFANEEIQPKQSTWISSMVSSIESAAQTTSWQRKFTANICRRAHFKEKLSPTCNSLSLDQLNNSGENLTSCENQNTHGTGGVKQPHHKLTVRSSLRTPHSVLLTSQQKAEAEPGKLKR